MQIEIIIMTLLVTGLVAAENIAGDEKQQTENTELEKTVLLKTNENISIGKDKTTDEGNKPFFYIAVTFGFLIGLASLTLLLIFIRRHLADIPTSRTPRNRHDSQHSGNSLIVPGRESDSMPVEDV